MMKNLSKNVVVSLIVVLISIFVLAGSVKALNIDLTADGTSGGGNDTSTGNTVDGNSTVTPANTLTATPTANSTVTPPTNVVKINEIGTEKDLPQTGENDIYMITIVGIAAIVIGSIAYAKSKKYDI